MSVKIHQFDIHSFAYIYLDGIRDIWLDLTQIFTHIVQNNIWKQILRNLL